MVVGNGSTRPEAILGGSQHEVPQWPMAVSLLSDARAVEAEVLTDNPPAISGPLVIIAIGSERGETSGSSRSRKAT